MPTLGSIDVGSNAMRLAVGFMDRNRNLHVVEDIREPVRLGQDVFTKGSISRETTQKAVEAFKRFREVLEQHQVVQIRAVGTSALREARNRDIFLKRIAQTSGIELKTLGTAE